MWGDEHDITAVEVNPEIAKVYADFFPDDNVVIIDAHEYLRKHSDEFDFIWSSPPCQSHSKMVKATRHRIRKYPDMSLYQEIIFLQNFFKGKWVVENVRPYYEPLIKPTKELGRHLAWCNFDIGDFDMPSPPNFINNGTVAGSQKLKDWLGMQYDGNIYYEGNHCPGQVLRNCVHPELGLHILQCASGLKVNMKQMPLFPTV